MPILPNIAIYFITNVTLAHLTRQVFINYCEINNCIFLQQHKHREVRGVIMKRLYISSILYLNKDLE